MEHERLRRHEVWRRAFGGERRDVERRSQRRPKSRLRACEWKKRSVELVYEMKSTHPRPTSAGHGAGNKQTNHVALINRLVRWLTSETCKAPVEEWDADRREAIKRDFQPLLEICGQL